MHYIFIQFILLYITIIYLILNLVISSTLYIFYKYTYIIYYHPCAAENLGFLGEESAVNTQINYQNRSCAPAPGPEVGVGLQISRRPAGPGCVSPHGSRGKVVPSPLGGMEGFNFGINLAPSSSPHSGREEQVELT